MSHRVLAVPPGPPAARPAGPLATRTWHCSAVCILRSGVQGWAAWAVRGGAAGSPERVEELGVASIVLPVQIHGSSSRRYKYLCALIGESGN